MLGVCLRCSECDRPIVYDAYQVGLGVGGGGRGPWRGGMRVMEGDGEKDTGEILSAQQLQRIW